jgi:O-antigen/teichoic acid export membrane protein
MQLLFPAEYSSTSSVFAAVAYGTVLNGVFMATVAGLYISKRTLMIGIVSIAAVLANLVANWLLIPTYGVNGAALGTLISSFIQLIIGYYFSRKLLPVKLPIGLIVGGGVWLGFVSWIVP